MRKEFYNISNKDLDLYMVNCGYEDCIDHFISHPYIRDYYLIHFVTKGSGYFETQNRKFYISTGDAFILYPGELGIYYSPDTRYTWSFCWIGFSGSKAKEYLASTGLSECVKRSVNQQFSSHILNCLNYIEGNRHSPSQIKLNICILNCLDVLMQDSKNKSLQAEDHVERALSYIEYNYTQHITTKDVCAYLNLDRTYFYRIFKKKYNISPEQYIMQYRIQKSLNLLQNTNYSISEIAYYVGVNDLYYFSRLFRKMMNMSPTEYRKSRKDASESSISHNVSYPYLKNFTN